MKWKARMQKLSTSASIRRAHAFLTRIPVLGPIAKNFARTVLPSGMRLWLRISGGLGKGLWVYVDPRYEMEYVSGEYETPVQQALSAYLQPGSVFYDVGAHIGLLSMFAARRVGPQGTVFAFEADPENANRINDHVSRNAFDQISVMPCAVSSSTGYLLFHRASVHSSRNRGTVAMQSSVGSENTIEVETITLDDFARAHQVPAVIKIDVEGLEADVLRGCEEILARFKPIVICEVHGEREAQDINHWLSKMDYIFEWLEASPQFPRHLLAKPRG